MCKFVFLIIISFYTLLGHSQANYSRVKVNLEHQNVLSLAALGVETDHGEYVKGRYLINDFSKQEITIIQEAGFSIEILIKDAEAFYEQQIRQTRPEEISSDYRGAETCLNSKLFNPKYKTPDHYYDGSMGGYYTYSELLTILDSMHFLYPNLITEKSAIAEIKTIEGRDIYYIKVSDNPTLEENEPEVLYTALHHAREPNSLTQMVFYLWYLLENYENDPEIRHLVDHTSMYFIPCVNPDGYVYNGTIKPNGGGLWRKNRNGSGIDLNRNYGYNWGYDDIGSSPDPSSSTYRGATAFSESESQAVKQLCESHDFKVTLNYHTHGNLLIHPWGYSDLPTEQHETFKLIGQEMIKANHYTFGTGSETVGYTVNGDSDDWMYGEEGIISLTPEVGPSSWGFWPPSYAIESLNKAAMYMNLIAAQIVHVFINTNDISELDHIVKIENQLDLEFVNIGLSKELVSFQIEELTNHTSFQTFQSELDLNHIEKDSLSIDYSLLDTEADEIIFLTTITKDGYSKYDTIRKNISSELIDMEIYTSFQDSMNNLINWTSTNSWGITDEQFSSRSMSLTDSPFDNYSDGITNIIDFTQGIDLKEEDYAELKYHAKWQIERGWDYVQVQISTDQENYENLCGNYSVLGNENQDLDEPLYDGIQNEWIQESISLNDYLGQIIYIRFKLVSDAYKNYDGIYIDDLQVNLSKGITKTIPLENPKIHISPNPFFDNVNLIFTNEQIDDNYLVSICDISGNIVLNKTITPGTTTFSLSLSQLPKGMYFLSLITDNNKVTHQKIIKY